MRTVPDMHGVRLRRGRDARCRRPSAYCLSLMLLAAGPIAASPAPPPLAQTPDTTKRILVLPAVQWNATASTWQYAVQQDRQPARALMGGLKFGM